MSGEFHGETCPTCGIGTLHDGVRLKKLEYRGETFVANQSGAYCDNCEDGVIYRDSSIEDRWKQFRADVDAKQAWELAEIRGRLHLTQEQASRLTGGGHNAFSRYERQEVQPMMAVINLFRLLDNHPQLLGELVPGLVVPTSAILNLAFATYPTTASPATTHGAPFFIAGKVAQKVGRGGGWMMTNWNIESEDYAGFDVQVVAGAIPHRVATTSIVKLPKSTRKQSRAGHG